MGADVDVVVVGAGAVGLACAARLARAGCSVLIVERHPRVGEETSTRNSGVIHAGLYYAPGSLKALTCVEGRLRLYARCEREQLPHLRCGKLLVACDDAERSQLEALCARGLQNGAGALRMVDAAELRRLEPRVRAVAALLSPETGIVDAYALVDSYRREALAHGGALSLRTTVEAIESVRAGLRVSTRGDHGERATVTATFVINAAGLGADHIAALAGLDVDALGYRQYPCKGDYFALAPALRGIVRHLIYPVPSQAGLGIHVTLDLQGGLRAGPDAEYVAQASHVVDAGKAPIFANAVRRYLPELRDADLGPDYAGLRPKLQGPGQTPRDFVIEDATRHGVPGLVNLFGIESPGLTASEAIAEHVARLINAPAVRAGGSA
jgi:L-2-hydroxyglutarate oxidase LhgO